MGGYDRRVANANEVYRRHFGDAPPARATVEVGLPGDLPVEIEPIALA